MLCCFSVLKWPQSVLHCANFICIFTSSQPDSMIVRFFLETKCFHFVPTTSSPYSFSFCLKIAQLFFFLARNWSELQYFLFCPKWKLSSTLKEKLPLGLVASVGAVHHTAVFRIRNHCHNVSEVSWVGSCVTTESISVCSAICTMWILCSENIHSRRKNHWGFQLNQLLTEFPP